MSFAKRRKGHEEHEGHLYGHIPTHQRTPPGVGHRQTLCHRTTRRTCPFPSRCPSLTSCVVGHLRTRTGWCKRKGQDGGKGGEYPTTADGDAKHLKGRCREGIYGVSVAHCPCAQQDDTPLGADLEYSRFHTVDQAIYTKRIDFHCLVTRRTLNLMELLQAVRGTRQLIEVNKVTF